MRRLFRVSALFAIISLLSVSAEANFFGLFFNGTNNLTGIKSDGTARLYKDGTLAASCLAYKTTNTARYNYNGTTGSGYYYIASTAGKLKVYCDMDLDGGGWTLLARSNAANCNSNFGWYYTSGTDPADTSVCYSLSPVTSGITNFTQIAFGNWSGSSNSWGGYAYRQNLSWGTIAANQTGTFYTGVPAPILGGDTVFNMAQSMGYTNGNTYFYFRDGGTGAIFGLMRNVWSLYYGPGGSDTTHPEWAGYINSQQGMIMIR